MDLLRLVLARQPLAKLKQLPVLLRSTRFLQTRLVTVNKPNGIFLESHYDMECLSDGELFPEAASIGSPKHLCNRAVFLLNAETLKYFSAQIDGLDFWYAISTGDREIIEIAFEWLDRDPRSLETFNDLESIPWTDELRNLFRMRSDLITGYFNVSVNAEKIATLMGFLELPLPVKEPQWHYFVGYCKYRLLREGGSTLEKNHDIEAKIPESGHAVNPMQVQAQWNTKTTFFIRSGYLYPLITQENNDYRWADILNMAFLYASEKLIHYIIRNRKVLRVRFWGYFYILIKRSYVERVKIILNDARIKESLPPEVVESYKIIAGYQISGIASEEARASVGNPDPDPGKRRGAFRYNADVPSLQGIVIYDPKSMDRSNVVGSEIIRLGLS